MDELRGHGFESGYAAGRSLRGDAGDCEAPAILLTGVGKRYDIVACFAALTTTVAVDPNPLAPAQYAAQVRAAPPPIADPGYVPALQELCERHGVGAVLPLTDLDIEVLAQARADGLLPALVPSPEVARATFDKYEAHLLLTRLGLPSPPTVLPGEEPESYPVMVKPRKGSGARSIHLARDAAERDFFVRYVSEGEGEGEGGRGRKGGRGGRGPLAGEPVMVQRAMGGPELSIDCLGDTEGRCLNAIPRTMLESRGGESIKGAVIRDAELIELGRRTMEALQVRGPATIQVFRDPDVGLGITDVNTRFGGAFPAPAYAALHGRTYPELIVEMAAGEAVAPHVGEFREGHTFTRYYWQLELDEHLHPTGREIVPGGPPVPRLEPRA
jgi:carbamoyl-phosphate synthase large subunit